MFGLLTCLSLSASQIREVTPTNANSAAFDLELQNNGQISKLTKSGYQVYVRYGNQNHIFASNRKTISQRNTFTAELEVTPVGDAVSVEVTVKNQKNGEIPIQVGVYAAFTKTALTAQKGNNAIFGQAIGQQHLIVIKGADKDVNTYHDPSSVYIGNSPSDTNIPIFENGITETSAEQDSAYAFSWNETITNKGTLKCKFLVYPNISVARGPFIYFKMDNKYNQYPSNFNFTFDVVSYDEGEVTIDKSNCAYMPSQPEPFSATASDYMKSYTVSGQYSENRTSYTCTLTATNSKTQLTSQATTLTFYKLDQNPPTWKFDKKFLHLPESVGDDLTFDVELTDEREIELWTAVHRNFVKGTTPVPAEEHFYRKVSTGPTGTITAHVTLNTLNDLHLGAGHHVVFLKFKDPAQNINEKIFQLSITLKAPAAPVLHSVSASPQRVHPGEEIAILGEITGPDANADINVSAYWNTLNSEPVVYEPIQAGSELQLFSIYYTIPTEGVNPEANTIIIKFVGKGNVTTTKNVTVYVPQPNPETINMAQIVDTSASLKSTSKSCFNLHYIGQDNVSRPMSNNDEGFYVAYRLLDIETNKQKGKTQYVTKAGGFQSSAYNFTVQYFNDTAPHTGYFQARFKVTNNDYFDQKFELGVFVDSNFGDSNQVIEMRYDDNGMVVSDEENNLYYTVFTQYDDTNVYPPVERVNFAPNVTRKSTTTEMDYSEMVFFDDFDYDSYRKYEGLDAMYSVGWRNDIIRAGTSQIYTLTFAGYDKIRSPSRIQRNVLFTPTSNRLDPDSPVMLLLTVFDDNVNETLDYEISVTGKSEPVKGSFTVKDATKPEILHTRLTGLTSGSGPFWNLSVLVKDQRNTTPTSIHESYFVGQGFDIKVNKIKEEYFPDDKITLSGSITGTHKPVYIMYQFGTTGREEKSPMTFSGSTFSFEISFPPEVTPSLEPRLIRAWAVDINGMLSTHNRIDAEFTGGEPVWNQSFLLTVKDKPVLHELGISKKKAQPGQEMLAYAVVNDTQYGRFIEIVYQFGTDDSTEWHSIDNERGKLHYDSVITTPFAFFWKVPSNAQVGKTYDVKFKARDASGLLSDETVTKTLVIAN